MSSYSTLLLDLDDTLYPPESGVWEAIGERIVTFVQERLRLSRQDARSLREEYTQTYGTTLKGLLTHHRIDAREYMDYVHNLPIHEHINPNPALKHMLAGLPQQIMIFTNADRKHAERVLDALGLGPEINDVIGYFELEPHNKPEPQAYARAMQLADEADPRKCVLVDDQQRNLDPAAKLGMTTVIVGTDPPQRTNHRQIARITDLAQALPDLNRSPGGEGTDARA